MKFPILLLLFAFSMPSFALNFYIQREVKNAYLKPKKNLSSKPAVNYRLKNAAYIKRKKLLISDKTFKYLSYQLKYVKDKLPVGFKKIEKLVIVPTFYKEKSNKGHQHGKYRPSSNIIEVNYKYLYKGYEKLLVRTLIHEISHAYEEEVENISKREKFLYVAGWHRKGLLLKWKKRRNFLNFRSPDPYEFTSPAEAFATNMEYFLTDPTFKCRRPLLNKYLSVELMEIPFWDEEYPCDKMLNFPMNKGDKIVWWKLDPSRIFEVHYLLADKGSAAMSMFGHSMIRLVICAPHRREVSKACMNDIEHHVVLSYRANITDTFLNTIKGLFGGYKSQLFVYSMVNMINEYTRDEFRNLISVPITLTKFQKQDFISKMQEEVWSYRGRYQFVTQNCATETLDFFKGFVDHMAFRDQFSLKPTGVLDIFHEYNMTYRPAFFSKSDEWKVKNGFLFLSKKPKYERFFNKFKRFTRYKNLDDYIEKSTPKERAKIIWHLRHNIGTAQQYSGMYLLEKYIKLTEEKKLQSEIIEFAEDDDGAKVLKDYIAKKLNAVRNQFPKMKIGYGIPTPKEFDQLKEYIENTINKIDIDSQMVKDAVGSKFSKDIASHKEIDENLKELRALTISVKF